MRTQARRDGEQHGIVANGWYFRELGEIQEPPVHGITCLAKGSDQVFARVVIALNGTFEVVLPARDYAQWMVDTGEGAAFCELLEQATAVQTTANVATAPTVSSETEAGR